MFRSRLKASNGQIISSSEACESKAPPEHRRLVKANADSNTVELTSPAKRRSWCLVPGRNDIAAKCAMLRW